MDCTILQFQRLFHKNFDTGDQSMSNEFILLVGVSFADTRLVWSAGRLLRQALTTRIHWMSEARVAPIISFALEIHWTFLRLN